jgi:hypothetical protein
MVFEAKLLGSDERVALKKISKKTVALEDFTREMATLKTIHEAGGIYQFLFKVIIKQLPCCSSALACCRETHVVQILVLQ